jgi:hypothetical protein
MVKKLEKGSTDACIKPHQQVLLKAAEVPRCDSAAS